MKIQLKLRRTSSLIFVIVLIMAIIMINNDLQKHTVIEKKSNNFITIIEKIENINEKTYIYSKNTLIKSYISDYDFKVGDILDISGTLKDNLSSENKPYGLYLKSRGYDYTLNANKMARCIMLQTCFGLMWIWAVYLEMSLRI